MRVLSAILCLGAGACAFGPQLQRVAVDHNALVADSNNELVLINILRARDREPLHFTSVSKLLGDASVAGTAGVSVQAKGNTETTETNGAGDIIKVSDLAGTDLVTPSVGLAVGGKSSMDVAVWDTQEFYQGITSSVPAGTLAHYLHQGWPADLMTHLFVSSVDFVAADDKHGFASGAIVETYVNDPDPRSRYRADFDRFVSCYRLTSIQKVTKDTPLVPLARLSEITITDLAALDGEKLDISAPVDENDKPQEQWIKRKGRAADTLALRTVTADDGEGQPCVASAKMFQLTGAGDVGAFRAVADEHSVIASGTFARDGVLVPVKVQVVLRSVEGVIYYLGEYLRAGGAAPLVLTDSGPAPIISVTTKRPPHVFVSSRFKRENYYVPGTDRGRLDQLSGRSSQVFALVQQLINLQKSAKDRPTTQTVRVVQ